MPHFGAPSDLIGAGGDELLKIGFWCRKLLIGRTWVSDSSVILGVRAAIPSAAARPIELIIGLNSTVFEASCNDLSTRKATYRFFSPPNWYGANRQTT